MLTTEQASVYYLYMRARKLRQANVIAIACLFIFCSCIVWLFARIMRRICATIFLARRTLGKAASYFLANCNALPPAEPEPAVDALWLLCTRWELKRHGQGNFALDLEALMATNVVGKNILIVNSIQWPIRLSASFSTLLQPCFNLQPYTAYWYSSIKKIMT